MAPIDAAETLPYLVLYSAGVFADMLHHRPQVLQVEQQQALVVGHLEHQLQHAALRVVEVEQAPEQQRPHVGNRGAHRMARFTEHVPEHHRAGLRLPVLDAELVQALLEFLGGDTGAAEPRQIALGVGQKHRHAGLRQLLGHALQGHRLAGTGGAGDQAVAVGQRRQQGEFEFAALGDGQRLGHGEDSRNAKICDSKC